MAETKPYGLLAEFETPEALIDAVIEDVRHLRVRDVVTVSGRHEILVTGNLLHQRSIALRGQRNLPGHDPAFAPRLVTCDVSFISVKLALPPVLRLAAPGWHALVLVKPQFEAGRAEAQKGVVRDAEVQRRVVREVVDAALGWGGETVGVVDSGLPGPKGNREFVLHLVQRQEPRLADDIDSRIASAVG